MAGFWSKIFSGEDKPSSAQTAKDRLKVIVASEQGLGRRLSQDKIDQMKKEIMQVVNRYVRGVDEVIFRCRYVLRPILKCWK